MADATITELSSELEKHEKTFKKLVKENKKLVSECNELQSTLEKLEQELLAKSSLQQSGLKQHLSLISEDISVPEIYVPKDQIYQHRLKVLEEKVSSKERELKMLESTRDQLKQQLANQEARFDKFFDSMKAPILEIPECLLPKSQYYHMPLLKAIYELEKLKIIIHTIRGIIPDKAAVLKLLTIPLVLRVSGRVFSEIEHILFKELNFHLTTQLYTSHSVTGILINVWCTSTAGGRHDKSTSMVDEDTDVVVDLRGKDSATTFKTVSTSRAVEAFGINSEEDYQRVVLKIIEIYYKKFGDYVSKVKLSEQ